MNFKKILALILVIAVCCGITAGLTIAYMTDEDEEHNVFTVGNIDIDLREEVGVIGAGTVVKNDGEGANHGATYTNVMPGDKLQKEVTIANTGNNPAYVAVTVILNNVGKIHSAIDKFYEAKYDDDAPQVQEVYSNVFQGWGINYNPRPGAYGKNDARRVIDGKYGLPEHVLHVDYTQTTLVDDTYQISVGNWFKSADESINPTQYSGYRFSKDGFYTDDLGGFSRPMGEYELKYTYFLYLEPGEESVLFEGLNVPYEFNEEQIKMFENLKIDIYAAGIQASGFADAKTAFAALAGETINHVDVTNVEELKDALANATPNTSIRLAEGRYQLEEGFNINSSLVAGGEVTLVVAGATAKNTASVTLGDNVTLKGMKIVNRGGDGVSESGLVTVKGENVVIEDCVFNLTDTNASAITLGDDSVNTVIRGCTFSGGYKHIGPAPGTTGGITIDGCKFYGASSTYAIHLNATKNDVIVKNCEIALFNTFFGFGGDAGALRFENCNFVYQSGKTNVVKLYRDADFVNCTFEDGFLFSDANKAIAVTFEGGSWGSGTIKAHFLADSFGNNMTATFDGEIWFWDAAAKTWTQQTQP